MSQQSPSLSQTQEYQPEFNPKEKKSLKKSKSKKTNQSLSKSISKKQQQKTIQKIEQKGKKKGGKKKEQKQKAGQQKSKVLEEKPQKQKKQGAKQKQRKPKSKKQPQSNQQSKAKVLEYMQKQNRPYNLLNIFDNLHGKIKKPELEVVLNELSDCGELSCKQFGKNKVYFLNQDKFDLNMQEVEQVGSQYTRLKEQVQQLRQENKKLTDEYRKLMSKKTMQQLQDETLQLVAKIAQLKKKRQYLLNQGKDNKMDEAEVIKIEKQGEKLEKELRKRRKLLKECLDSWCEMTEKKLIDVIEAMGIQMG